MTDDAREDGRRDELDSRPLKRARVAGEGDGSTREEGVAGDTVDVEGDISEGDGEGDESNTGIPEPSRASDLYLDTVWC